MYGNGRTTGGFGLDAQRQQESISILSVKNAQRSNNGESVTGKEKFVSGSSRMRKFRYKYESEGVGPALKSLFHK